MSIRRSVVHNATQNYIRLFEKPFTVDPAFIDCKEMSQNYTNGLIPLTELARAVDTVVGPWQGRSNHVDDIENLEPYFEEVPVEKVFSHPSFNRDTSPNHCAKLEADWHDQFAMISLGVKMPEKYGGVVLCGDSTHTSINRIRKGKKSIPFWLADVPDQGDEESTLAYAFKIVGHLFLAINVRNKRSVDIFDQHHIKVATNIYPAPQINAIIDNIPGVAIKRAGNKIAYAIHNLNETYKTFDLDKETPKPGKLLSISLNWLVRNFKHQSIDGCLLTSFAMFMYDLENSGLSLTAPQADQLAFELKARYITANDAQLEIKKACLLLNKSNPGYTPLDSNYVVSNGLKHIAQSLQLPTARDELRQWAAGF